MKKETAGINEIELLLNTLSLKEADKISDIEGLLTHYSFTKSTLEVALYNISKNNYYKKHFKLCMRLKMLLLEEIIKHSNPILSKI